MPYWTFTALERIGEKLTIDNFGKLKEMIDECLKNPKYAQGRREVRAETWEYQGEGTKRAVDYLVKKYQELPMKEDK